MPWHGRKDQAMPSRVRTVRLPVLGLVGRAGALLWFKQRISQE